MILGKDYTMYSESLGMGAPAGARTETGTSAASRRTLIVCTRFPYTKTKELHHIRIWVIHLLKSESWEVDMAADAFRRT